MFGLKKREELRHATARAVKRLREKSCDIGDASGVAARGRPPKRARLCDLKRVYDDLE